MSYAAKSIDRLATMINEHETPQGYKADLVGEDASDVADLISRFDNLMAYQKFEEPKDLLPRAIGLANQVVKSITQTSDYSAIRLARRIKSHLEDAYTAASIVGVKSMGLYGWQDEHVSNSFNLALNDMSKLHQHVRSQI